MKTISVIGLFFLLFFQNCLAQNSTINLNQFISETQRNSSEEHEIKIVWWIPVEFWKISFQNNNSLTEEQANEFITALSPYTIFAIVDGKMGSIAGINYTPPDSIKQNITLFDAEKKMYKPLEEEEINPDVQNLLAMFKPVFKNMMGKLGENMNFFVFKDMNDKQVRVFDPYSKGSLQITLGKKKYEWRTPLASLVPLKKCPVDNEQMNGTWEFCPWHGKKLGISK